MNNCIFCKIIKKELPAEVVYEDDHALAFLDISPISKGHTLVIPKKHFENVFDIDESSMESLYRAVRNVAPAVRSGVEAEGVNINNNNGEAAGQEVFHYHVHIIPRHADDNLQHWPNKEYVENEMGQVGEKIRKSF